MPAAASVETTAAASQGADVTVPAMGESVTEGTVAKWSKRAGDAVKKDEVLVEIETDKVAIEVSAAADGVLSEILAQEGDTVTPNQVIARIGGGGSVSASPNADTPVQQPSGAGEQTPPTSPPPRRRVPSPPRKLPPAARASLCRRQCSASSAPPGWTSRASPAPARTGASPRATRSPPRAHPRPPRRRRPRRPPRRRRAQVAAGPRPDQPNEERVRMTRLRQTIARRLKDAQNTAAQLTTFNEVDMSAVMALRNQYKDVFEKRHGVKLGFMSFFVKACIAALKEIPAVNGEIDGQDLIYKNHYDIGVAVGTEKGLVVPVLRDADALSLAGVEKAIGDMGRKARDGQLSIEDMTGGTFTITNGGIYGSLMSTPILNMPQAGILGMHNIVQRPIAVDGKVEIRPMMYLALSYDHRIVDGKEAVTFLVARQERGGRPQAPAARPLTRPPNGWLPI